MKKLFFLVVMLFATQVKAQTETPITLPDELAKGVIIERSVINKQDVIYVRFNRRLNECEIELIKNYIGYYYEKPFPKGSKYCSMAPDIYNKRFRCVIVFYKQ